MAKTPIERLIGLGDYAVAEEATFDYAATLGISEKDVPALIDILLDTSLDELDEADPRLWAQFHAIWALGQLGAVEAVEPLFQLHERQEDDFWLFEIIPSAIGLIGASAIPLLEIYCHKQDKSSETILTAVESLKHIAKLSPETHPEVIGILIRLLERAPENDPGVNGIIVSALMELDAKDALPTIEYAFKTDMVDLTIVGDYEDVQAHFGLAQPPLRRNYRILEMQRTARLIGLDYEFGDPYSDFDDEFVAEPPDFSLGGIGVSGHQNKKKKAKRKQADKARKRNRKK